MPPDRERDLDRELADLGFHIEYPPTPDLARSARRRIDEEAARQARRGWFGSLPASPKWAAAAAALVLILAVPVFSPAARDTLSSWLVAGQGVGGAAGEAAKGASSGQEMQASETDSSADLPAGAGGTGRTLEGKLRLGERITLQQARAGADGPVFLPRTPKLGKPDEVYATGLPEQGNVTFVYRARPGLPPLGDSGIGLLLTQLSSSLESTYFPEGIPNGTDLETVSVGGDRGYWVPDGRRLRSQAGKAENLPGGALLWEREGHALLLRADLSKEGAVRIAESVR